MKEPKRLIHTDPGFARLVAAAQDDEPPSSQIQETLALVMRDPPPSRLSSWWWTVPCVVLVGGVVVSSMFAGQKADSALPAVAPGASTSPTMVPPAMNTVFVDDLAAAPPVPQPSPPTEPPRARSTPERHAITKAPMAVPSTTAPSAPVPSAPAPPIAAPAIPAPSSTAAERPSTFREELALVITARSTLEEHDLASCIRAVDRYDARFPSGVFAQEISVLRIEALVASGERARAVALAQQFLTRTGDSPYAERVRTLLDRAKDTR